MAQLSALLGDEISDADEETFLLYAQQPLASSRDLGFVDRSAESVEVSVAGREVTVYQSQGLLASNRAAGTTGAVLWRVTPPFASWLASAPAATLLSALTARESPAAVLELGCGISPLNAVALRRRVSSFVLSDQEYVQKVLRRNMTAARLDVPEQDAKRQQPRCESAPVYFRPLDWETDAVTAALCAPARCFDVVLACDCVFNEALLPPFVQTCVDVCRLKRELDDAGPCACIVAQQLRSDIVFSAWMTLFLEAFHVWRVPDELLPDELRLEAGFVIHVAILRDA